MTPLIRLDLSQSGCRKPRCKHGFSAPPHRHHMGHEKHFLNLWQRVGPPTFKGSRDFGKLMVRILRDHYYAFRERDIVRICERHHIEIHDVYRAIVKAAKIKFNKDEEDFTFEEALWVMRECRKYCRKWLTRFSHGYNPTRARRENKW